jgi:hypothetical protein
MQIPRFLVHLPSILINFLKSKIDLNLPKFSFQIHFEYEEVPMKKFVPLCKSFKTIFYFNFFECGKALFGLLKVRTTLNLFYLNPFEF